MGNISIKQAFSVARTEYLRWITNPRVIIIGVLLLFIKTLAIEPLSERAAKFAGELVCLEPFVAVGNSGVLLLLMPCVFLVLISDYPILNGSTLFFVHRTGRINWYTGQVIFLVMAICTFLGAVLLFSILVSGGTPGIEWSDAVTKYNSRFPEEAVNFDSQLLPSNLYNQIPLLTAVLQTFVLMGAYLLLLSLIMYFFKLLFLNALGLAAAAAAIALGTAAVSLDSAVMWAFPTANTMVWLHYEEIIKQPVYPIWCSFAYFGVITALFIVLDILALNKTRFS